MTEAEWLACTDPEAMLGFLQGKASDRKLRLFACASIRLSSSSKPIDSILRIGELQADGLASPTEVQEAQIQASSPAFQAYLVVVHNDVARILRSVFALEFWLWGGREKNVPLLREIFGNPFRPIVLEPSWLAWNDHA
ncbi:MAG TPA: hypothetical protein VKD72_05505 [Gemmataceae bacterium]|nr:hypothetical protein [Gemmataceae bacterium]